MRTAVVPLLGLGLAFLLFKDQFGGAHFAAFVAMFLLEPMFSCVFLVIGPVVLFALFYKRTNKWGALAGMVSGAVMVFLWKFVISGLGGAFAIYELLPAFVISSIFILVVSHVTAAPSKEVTDVFEEVKAAKLED